MADETTDEQIPAMPEDFASTPHTEAWKRLQRSNRRASRIEADLTTERERAASLAAELEQTRAAAARAAELEREVGAARTEAQRWQQRIPLIRAGIEDDDVAELLIARHAATQAGAKEPIPLDSWLREHAAADKIAARLLPTRAADPTPPATAAASPDRGSGVVASEARGSKITRAEYLQESQRVQKMGGGYSRLMRDYLAQESQPVPDKRFWRD